ncbi:XRE family transcriptional regulator [uncultured Sneathiella sp.]|jgi:transcriptional regulator with XRE-family HTH domain|uniref:helix-turn-helix domain-containing protein n=1 Tax=uncultured Sneathiella sp. TaxID=879315 RepID=UPI0030DAFA45|tara:strand:+ start:241 stop:840 length:600 start_codon:yes stop_codon:yes gene_type:complete
MSGLEAAKISEDGNSRAQVAERVREIRRKKGLTIKDVATRSGLAISTVSKIERNLMAPTYDRFSRLADGLGVDVSELFMAKGEQFLPGEFSLARIGEHSFHQTENYTYEMLFPHLRGKSMIPMLGTLKPFEKMRFDRLVSHEGEEFFFVLKGKVVVQLEGKDPVVLETGESIYFDSRRGHLYASAGDTDARILCVCTKM